MTELHEQGPPEPPVAADEAATLCGFLERQRATLAWKCSGLDAAGLGRPARRTWPRDEAPSLRWILLHMIEEYARHSGHADLLRESVDGLTGE